MEDLMDGFRNETSGALAPGLGRSQQYVQPSYAERVSVALKENEDRVAVLKRMQQILADHPALEELLTLMAKVHI